RRRAIDARRPRAAEQRARPGGRPLQRLRGICGAQALGRGAPTLQSRTRARSNQLAHLQQSCGGVRRHEAVRSRHDGRQRRSRARTEFRDAAQEQGSGHSAPQRRQSRALAQAKQSLMDLPEQVPGAERSQFALLKVRRFLPFFLTQFFGAFNDNLFRIALVVSITYGATMAAGQAAVLSNLAQGLFILPFFLFSALSGQLADKYEKSRLIRQTRLAEVVLMCAGAVALYYGKIPMMLTVIFLLGVLATIFGPLKYSLMPQHLRQSELVGGNALVDAGTFLAILIGTIAGGLLAPTPNVEVAASGGDGHLAASVTMVGVAVAMYLCARAIPAAPATDPTLKVNFNPITSTLEVIRFAAKSRTIFLSLLGISWFWLVGALILARLPAYARDVLGGDKTVYTLLLAAFSIGTALGSLACERLSGHKVEIGLVPLGSIGMTVCLLSLYFSHPGAHPDAPGPGI